MEADSLFSRLIASSTSMRASRIEEEISSSTEARFEEIDEKVKEEVDNAGDWSSLAWLPLLLSSISSLS